MDVCYYNNQIREELDGATAYIQKAIALKKERPQWANMYIKMGMAELEHASILVKIFEDDYKLLTSTMPEIPTYLSSTRESMLGMYAEFSAKAKYLHETYDSL